MLRRDTLRRSSPPSPAKVRLPEAPLLLLPDDILRRIFHHVLDSPVHPLVLSGRTLLESDHAFSLASTCTVFRRIFRTSITTLHVDWDTPIYIHTLATLFGPSLRHLHVRNHSRADAFLIHLTHLPACPALSHLSLENCAVSPDPLNRLLCSAAPLRALRLHFVDNPDLPALLTTAAPSLRCLQSLDLRGLSQLTHVALLAVCGSAGRTLRHFGLRYARHSSVCDDTLVAVSRVCPRVTSVFFDDVRHASEHGVLAICEAYAPALTALRLYSCRVPPRELRGLLRLCVSLEELGIEEATWAADAASVEVQAAMEVGSGLRVFHLRDVQGVSDEDVRALVSSAPKLHHFAVRRQEFVTDSMMFQIARRGERLRHLDVRGCFVTDCGLEEVGKKCPLLEAVFLGGDGQHLSREGVSRISPDAVTNAGMDKLLVGCGGSLRQFTWETPKCIMQSATGRDQRVSVGVARLSAKLLAKSLSAWCPNLLRVEVNGLRPPARERVERARCDLAFIELEEAAKYVVVSMDCEQPF